MSISVILDTNIFISGIFWEGNLCSEIIDAWRDERLILITSLELIKELVDTLQDFKIEMPEDTIEAWRKSIMENTNNPRISLLDYCLPEVATTLQAGETKNEIRGRVSFPKNLLKKS